MEQLNQSDATSHDIVADNIDKLKAIFPEAFTEGKIDFDVLKETLGEYRETREERYNFSWAGKSKARRLAQTPSTGTLRPCPEESVDWDKTENLFIEGDNLEVLKLLQKSYQGQVKMIYIDPPYNTGGDFVYPDKYADNLKGYLEYTNQVDADGHKQSSNTEASGRYHSNWLNMMLPRLLLARNLLCKKGVIFISIDDNEHSTLKRICDDVFGEENFVANFIWEKRITRENRKVVSPRHDHIICYCRDILANERAIDLLPMDDEALSRYKNPDNDPRGRWTSVPAIAQAGHGTKNQFYSLTTPSGRIIDPPSGSCWRYTSTKMDESIADNRIWFGSDGKGVPRIKKFLNEGQQGLTVESLWWAKDVGTNDTAKRELIKLFDGKAVFETPKPTTLIKRMLQIATDKDSLILDFFSGTSPTAHAIIDLNKEDKGNRKFILVQLPEPCDETSEAAKTGYKTIAEIGKERIRRASKKIKEEHPDYEGDLGFKVFKLDSSNIEAWDSNIENLEDNVLKAANVLKDDRSELDIVYELFLKYGLDLSYPVNTHEVAGKQVYEIGAGSLFICLEDGITTDFVEALIKLYESFDDEAAPRVVFKDSGFKTDAAKKDAESTLKDAGILDVKCL